MEKNIDNSLRELMGRAREGDRWAYGRVFRLCYKDIYDYVIRRVGNSNDAEDLTMKVFTKGLVAVTNYEERGCSVRAWLYRIAHNVVVDHYRVLKKKVDLEEIPEVEDSRRGLVDAIVHKEEVLELYRNVRRLPTAQGEVLILRFMEDLSVAEVAEVLGKKETTVRALQFKGVKNLKKQIEAESGVTVVPERTDRKS